ncbi:MAG TPA: 5-oxoprolinase subunit PxpA [Streptosporangiaceae bacterium]|nr:5-oxoprolinase subunit PxpA [Streptosporangiaceae bacterium]
MIDLNSDMGESFGSWTMGADEAMLGQVTSANIACGFHGGDPRVMDATVAMAAERGVVIGAHVSYPDLVGFGRRPMKVSPQELITDVLYQIGALEAFCRRHGTEVRYVKAHGALYNDLAGDQAMAAALGEAVTSYGGLAVLVLGGSPAAGVLRDQGIHVVREGFADRGYTAAGRLVPRSQPGAVLTDPAAVAERGWRIATGAAIEADDGTELVLAVDSLCVHGDTPGAVELARELRAVLTAREVEVAPFA